MRTWNLFALIIIAALVSACAASAEAPPEIQVDRSACDHCTMLISEARYAQLEADGIIGTWPKGL